MSRCLWKSGAGGVRATAAAVVLALLAAATVGCGSPLTPEQKEAFAKVQRLGGKVNREGSGLTVDLSGTLVEDGDLACLKVMPDLVEVDLRRTKITDKGLEHLSGIKTLQNLKIQRTAITTEASDRLKEGIPELKVWR